MANDKDKITRDRPAEEGRKNDPDLRDETDIQPGVSTISSSPTDEANQHLTKTASDNFRTTEFAVDADKRFDEVDEDNNE